MTRQLDRLAAILEAELDGRAVFTGPVPPERDVVMLAGSLLARNVMVVDEEVLENALRTLPEYAETPSYRRHAIDLLAALIMGGVA